MLSDIEIAENCKLKDIREIAKKLSLDEDSLEPYGKYKAKINLNTFKLLLSRGLLTKGRKNLQLKQF